MKLVVDHTGRFRLIVPLPWVVGELQAAIMRLLPASIFTITPDQVRLHHLSTDRWLVDTVVID